MNKIYLENYHISSYHCYHLDDAEIFLQVRPSFICLMFSYLTFIFGIMLNLSTEVFFILTTRLCILKVHWLAIYFLMGLCKLQERHLFHHYFFLFIYLSVCCLYFLYFLCFLCLLEYFSSFFNYSSLIISHVLFSLRHLSF